ncbi:head-tail adaptor protein [Clostridium botulinum]|uniref:head-tail adaptor protein n=1 Tax=Clostridium botulinum TaxID=1491 RepID=UPI0007E0DDE8|nr:head-tail adaptor protein [Clostridium botulinum]KEI84247.1 head-tail adaptor protein [Clostridium botulinum B2 267]MBY6801531.1 head-tail adaptor protein [Clostridium botulinum]MBY6998852.1 head-tail adaptor protein [Clostridium botulinum]MBY7012907.1 head-tail adaptor protein [Clostridium botulinum]MCR1156266.1 head-tail adaptor protein [Clostridium botulinum]
MYYRNFAKKIIIFLIFTTTISLFGCKKNKEDTKVTNDFDIKIATNLFNSYMESLIEENMEGAQKLYSKKLKKDKIKKENKDVKIKGYTTEEINEVGKSALFIAKVVSVNVKEPYTSVEEYKIRVIKEENEYKIDEVNISMDKEAFTKNNRIRYRNKNNVKTELIIKPSTLPDYSYAKDDKANIEKLTVPKKNIGPMSLSYSENFIAISTYDKNSYIGIITIDESKAVQGGQDQGGQGEQGEQGGAGGGETRQEATDIMEEIGEKPIGKEISSLDLLKGSKIDFMVFSPDEKFIAVQYETSDKTKNTRIYQADSAEIIPFKMEDKFPLNKVNVTLSSFATDSIIFNVSSKEKNDKNLTEFIGKWQLDLKEFKVKKM